VRDKELTRTRKGSLKKTIKQENKPKLSTLTKANSKKKKRKATPSEPIQDGVHISANSLAKQSLFNQW
jgi:hypothetical protein